MCGDLLHSNGDVVHGFISIFMIIEATRVYIRLNMENPQRWGEGTNKFLNKSDAPRRRGEEIEWVVNPGGGESDACSGIHHFLPLLAFLPYLIRQELTHPHALLCLVAPAKMSKPGSSFLGFLFPDWHDLKPSACFSLQLSACGRLPVRKRRRAGGEVCSWTCKWLRHQGTATALAGKLWNCAESNASLLLATSKSSNCFVAMKPTHWFNDLIPLLCLHFPELPGEACG